MLRSLQSARNLHACSAASVTKRASADDYDHITSPTMIDLEASGHNDIPPPPNPTSSRPLLLRLSRGSRAALLLVCLTLCVAALSMLEQYKAGKFVASKVELLNAAPLLENNQPPAALSAPLIAFNSTAAAVKTVNATVAEAEGTAPQADAPEQSDRNNWREQLVTQAELQSDVDEILAKFDDEHGGAQASGPAAKESTDASTGESRADEPGTYSSASTGSVSHAGESKSEAQKEKEEEVVQIDVISAEKTPKPSPITDKTEAGGEQQWVLKLEPPKSGEFLESVFMRYKAKFNAESRKILKWSGQSVLLRLEALKMQALFGDCDHEPERGLFRSEAQVGEDEADRKSLVWDVWCGLRGTSSADAMRHFVYALEKLAADTARAAEEAASDDASDETLRATLPGEDSPEGEQESGSEDQKRR